MPKPIYSQMVETPEDKESIRNMVDNLKYKTGLNATTVIINALKMYKAEVDKLYEQLKAIK